MHNLYHYPICPLSRQVRIYLKEFGIEFNMLKEFIKLSPAGHLPVFELSNPKSVLVGIYPITEYIVETFEDFYFMDKDPVTRGQVRKYINWFNEKFYREVSKILIDEKVIRLLMRKGEPRSNFIMAAKSNLVMHLKFLDDLLTKNTYIVSEKISCADITAACHISTMDYFGEINWSRWHIIKEWYSVIKSRPSFQSILQDRIAGFVPPKEYASLDF
ncbi:glutathione S-transferase family protein [Rickettsiaceae bacterium]|nr:glutathione S-transferase family protein [Rickettsiaceae bacterium]